MSLHVHALVYSRRFGSPARKAIALKLADHAGDDGSGIYPSIARIAAETELDPKTVRRIIRGFEGNPYSQDANAGIPKILTVVRQGGKGPGSTIEWRMDLEAVHALSETWEKAGLTPALAGEKAGLRCTKAGLRSEKGGPQARQTINEPSRTNARKRAVRLSNGKWSIPKGSKPFEAWRSHAKRISDYPAEFQCNACEDDGAIERATLWPA